MLKKFSKFLLLFLLIFVVSSSSIMCLADEPTETTNTTSETNEEVNSTDEATAQEIHSGDLYLFDNNIVMDKLVDGNVFIFGNNVEITGQVNGNLFVFGNKVSFNESIVRYSIFVCANSVYYNGGSGTSSDYGNLYVATNKLETTYNSFVTGDIKAVASSIILRSAIYRDVDLLCNTVDFGEGEDIPLIYGNLRYTAIKEATIPEDVLGSTNSSVTYTSSINIINILLKFATCIITVLALYIILNKLTPNFMQKVCNNKFSAISILKAFGIGLATVVIASIFVILLAGTYIGILLAVILTLLFAILCIIAMPTLAINITSALKPALKIEKNSIFYLVLSLVSIILHGITLIPFVGGLLGLLINIIAIGLLVNMYLPHKELTEEEKTIIEEAKKQGKENKEKRKQEKIDAKAAKNKKN